jgi:hypothetical protein
MTQSVMGCTSINYKLPILSQKIVTFISSIIFAVDDNTEERRTDVNTLKSLKECLNGEHSQDNLVKTFQHADEIALKYSIFKLLY